MKPPEILVYAATSYPDAPNHMRFAAAMVSDGRPGTHWMATGSSAEESRAKLEAMWARQFPTTKRGQHLRKTAEPLDVVL